MGDLDLSKTQQEVRTSIEIITIISMFFVSLGLGVFIYSIKSDCVMSFIAFLVYFSSYVIMSIGIKDGYYKLENLRGLGKNRIKGKIKIEEIELTAIFGAFLFATYFLITSIDGVFSSDIIVKRVAIIKLFILGWILMGLTRWLLQNEHNLKVLGSKLDEIEDED
jgi:hypothetical protein